MSDVSDGFDEFDELVALMCGTIPPLRILRVAATAFYFVLLDKSPHLLVDAILLLAYAGLLHDVVDP